MMNLLKIKNKNGLVLNRGLCIDIDSYLERFKRLHESLNVDCSQYLDIEIIQVNVSYDSLLKNKFANRFDIEELKEIGFLPLTNHLYKVLQYNY